MKRSSTLQTDEEKVLRCTGRLYIQLNCTAVRIDNIEKVTLLIN